MAESYSKILQKIVFLEKTSRLLISSLPNEVRILVRPLTEKVVKGCIYNTYSAFEGEKLTSGAKNIFSLRFKLCSKNYKMAK